MAVFSQVVVSALHKGNGGGALIKIVLSEIKT